MKDSEDQEGLCQHFKHWRAQVGDRHSEALQESLRRKPALGRCWKS